MLKVTQFHVPACIILPLRHFPLLGVHLCEIEVLGFSFCRDVRRLREDNRKLKMNLRCVSVRMSRSFCFLLNVQ